MKSVYPEDFYHWKTFWRFLLSRWILNQPRKINTIISLACVFTLICFSLLQLFKCLLKAQCFSSLRTSQFVKCKHNVKKILIKQSLESFSIKQVTIFQLNIKLCNNAQNALQLALGDMNNFFVLVFLSLIKP